MHDWKMNTFAAVAAAGLIATGIGCAGEESSPADSSTTETVEIPENMIGIAELPPAAQQAALAQKICPVTEEPLGSMGKPIEVELKEGRKIFVCCDGCVDAVKENPDEYLAKLPKSAQP